ncbi:MAG: ATP-binding cassette domain-containing protein [Desulfobacterales bacterium]|nr:ATP-binding cassette domain-containing protein [Desulfobacterales bacterium]MDD4072092.1 ATP-binding cassette domain-containing protein [Desulfobacterales bacterium]MDD4393483.1 ATP-binding cassette domain-containing protein [Desulfobacterales bacterium]
MALMALNNVNLGFGDPSLFDNVDLQIEQGERICLIGRNGTGKSTLLKLLHGEMLPDSGVVAKAPGLKTALLTQEVPPGLEGSVYDVVASGQPHHAALLGEYNRLTHELGKCFDQDVLERLNQIQHELETVGAWHLHQQVQTIISRMDLDEEASFGVLSAGLKRRVFLARALVNDPDILLLDEPTNHLDIDAIIWMENFLLRSVKTLLFVTHDRALLKLLATRIVEIDRASLRSFPGNYDTYLRRKQEQLDSEDVQNAEFDKHVRREEIWLRQGVKARRTRNEGRVRALMQMREEVRQRRARSGSVCLVKQEAEKSGKLVIKADDISFGYSESPILSGFSTTIMRGDKVGIIGRNGCGKTTLLRILLGEIKPESGIVRHGARLEVAYFDQLRAQLDESRTLQQNVAEDGDTVFVGGKPRHIIGYLQDFLFSPAQARAPITRLSGGERNRLLLAKLFTRPSNVMVLDEPTNDLDVETLDLLEELLVEYEGTVLMVSHDRAFLNNVVTSTLVFEGQGRVQEYVGGYDDWMRQRPQEEKNVAVKSLKKDKPRSAPSGPRKLTFKEQRELEQLPDIIEALESKKQALFTAMSEPDMYKTAGTEIGRLQASLDDLERDLTAAYARWEQLEELSLKLSQMKTK